jgi:hypothetical protein
LKIVGKASERPVATCGNGENIGQNQKESNDTIVDVAMFRSARSHTEDHLLTIQI